MTESTNWTPQIPNSTNYVTGPFIPNLGAIMDDSNYKMDDTILTMDDKKVNPLFTNSTNFTPSTPNSTNWTKA